MCGMFYSFLSNKYFLLGCISTTLQLTGVHTHNTTERDEKEKDGSSYTNTEQKVLQAIRKQSGNIGKSLEIRER